MSRQEVTATLKSCAPIYHKIFDRLEYHPTEDDLDCLNKFKQLWSKDLMVDEPALKEAAMSYEQYGFLVGYVTNLKQQRKWTK